MRRTETLFLNPSLLKKPEGFCWPFKPVLHRVFISENRRQIFDDNMLTRIGSVASPSSHGVFATTTLKAGTRLHAMQDRDVAASLLATSGAVDRVAAKRERRSYTQPYRLMLSALHPKRMSLVHFLALRHTWASERFLYIQQDSGIFVALPSDFAPGWVLEAAERQVAEEQLQWSLRPPAEAGEHYCWDDVIPEQHLFAVRDVQPLPELIADDVTNAPFWQSFREQWAKYGVDAAPNAALCVDDAIGGRLQLRTLRHVEAGEELRISHGRALWTQRMLAKVFLAAEDHHIRHIRWIEALLGKDKPMKPFPQLQLCKRRLSTGKEVVEVGDTTTRGLASPSAVVAYSLRRSCQDADFFRALLDTAFGCGAPGMSYPDLRPLNMVSIDGRMKPAVLNSLVGKTEREDESGGIVL